MNKKTPISIIIIWNWSGAAQWM